jgi:hypothetical protein
MNVISREERQALYVQLPPEHFLAIEYGRNRSSYLDPVYIGPCVLIDSATNEPLGYLHGVFSHRFFLRRFIKTKAGKLDINVMTLDEWKATYEQVLANAQARYDRERAVVAEAKKITKRGSSGEIPI